MSRILVQIRVPASDVSSDALIPYECRLNEVNDLVKALFADRGDAGFTPVDDTVLCNAVGEVLDLERSAMELGLENGSKLLLI